MTENKLQKELQEQGVTHVKRFTFKSGDKTLPSNTYLMEFSTSSPPPSIKAGYCNVKVDLYIPNPLRCYKCQKFGHGSRSCRSKMICQNCGESDHESQSCKKEPHCHNCGGPHTASFKQCPSYVKEAKII